MISRLPWQALSIIADNCGQADCVSLGIACPPLMPFIAPRLYRAIVLDLGPRALGKHIEFEHVSGHGYQALTLVRTSAGLRRCLQVLADHPQWACRVWSLKAKSNLPLSDCTMRQLISGAFKNLHSLVQLEWLACPELPVDALDLLPNKPLLQELNADLAIRFKQEYPEIRLDSLRKLQVRPFLGTDCLEWLKSLVKGARGLCELELCRFLDEKREVGSGYAFVGLSDIPSAQNSVRLISDFFEPCVGEKLALKRLELIQFLHDNDAHLLKSCIDLHQVHTLGFAGTDAPGSECLLDAMMHTTPQVKYLSLDWNTPAANLAKYLDHFRLEELEICVYAEPLQVLLAVSRQTELKKLRVSTKCRFTEADFEPLKKCTHLESLAMPFSFQVRTWTLIEPLRTLRHLQLKYSGDKHAQGHSSNSLVSCGLLSMWNDEFAYPLQFAGLIGDLRHHTSLRLVDIDGHSHTLKPDVC